jgi:hypothetical protein
MRVSVFMWMSLPGRVWLWLCAKACGLEYGDVVEMWEEDDRG